jgi:hypothetical protein
MRLQNVPGAVAVSWRGGWQEESVLDLDPDWAWRAFSGPLRGVSRVIAGDVRWTGRLLDKAKPRVASRGSEEPLVRNGEPAPADPTYRRLHAKAA